MNLTKCYSGIPTFLSMEFFYGAPDYNANNSLLNISQPAKENPTFINVEPHTGAIIQANAGMQINFPIHSLPVNNTCISRPNNKCKGESLYNIPNDMMIPTYLIWFGINVTDNTVDNMWNNLLLGIFVYISIYFFWL